MDTLEIKHTPYVIILIFGITVSSKIAKRKEVSIKENKELEIHFLELRDYFGSENLRMDLQQEIVEAENDDSLFIEESKIKYIKVRITHIPSGKVTFGKTYNNQLENSIEALTKLKEEVKNTNPQQ